LIIQDRAAESISMALNITNDLIQVLPLHQRIDFSYLQSVIQEVRNHIEELFAVVDSIALLDMLMWDHHSFPHHIPAFRSFAEMIGFDPSLYSRSAQNTLEFLLSIFGSPKLRISGPLVLDNARHPGDSCHILFFILRQ
jgi:hypothetical protein